jgi:MarR family transcriptional regulator for hemolysin
VRFSARGRKLVQKAIIAIENADDEFFSCLSARQLESYKALTAAVIEGNTGSDV